jgi:hypothetical protein
MAETMMGPAQASVRRRLPSVQYQAGVRNTVTLDRDGVLSQLNFVLRFRIANGATAPIGPLWNALSRLLRRVEVVIDGQDTVMSINGPHMASRALLEFGARPLGMEATVVLTASATTDYTVVLPLPMYLPRGRRPDDTSLDLRKVNQAIVAVTWGDISDIFATPGATAALSNVSLNLEGEYLVNPAADALFMARSLDIQDVTNPASNANLQALIDRGSDMFWRSFHIVTTRNNVAVGNIITNDIRLTAGAFTYANREAVAIQGASQRNASLPLTEFGGDPVPYRVDLAHLGQGTTYINAAGLTGDLYLVFGTTFTSGTEIISISREALRPLRNR